MNKVGECAMEAIKTFLSGKRQGGGGGRGIGAPKKALGGPVPRSASRQFWF